MKGLSQLTEKIRDLNYLGLNLLPTLEIAIVHNVKFTTEVVEVLKIFGCHDLLYSENVNDPLETKMQDIQKITQHQTTKQSQIQSETKYHSELLSSIPQTEQKPNMITLHQFDPRLKSTLYTIYLTHKPIQSRIHLVVDLEHNQQINDQILKRTKKIIEKLKRNKSIIFVNFNPTTHKLDEMSEHIQQFGLNFRTKQRQILGDQLLYISHPKQPIKRNKITANKSKHRLLLNNKHNFTQLLMNKIQKKYISLFGVQINKNYLEIKTLHKQVLMKVKWYNEIFEIIKTISKLQKQQIKNDSSCNNRRQEGKPERERILTKHALTNLHRSKQYLISSLIGTYTYIDISQSSHQPTFLYQQPQQLSSPLNLYHRSLHWQVMQIMNQIWDIEGDSLLKQIDKMPLSYIKQRYKMLNYETIAGFMPAKCFETIFSAPLRKMVQHIMETLEIIQLKIIAQLKRTIQHFFHHTTFCYDLSQLFTQQITIISRLFRHQTQRVLKSHIQFISVSSQDFWSFKQLNTGIYGPQQQIFIEIKYIGKNYIKKVFQSIKETLPRLVGQNLLKEIVYYLENKSLQVLTTLMSEKQFDIEINSYELEKINILKEKEKRIDNLVYYFSLKTSSEVNLKNLNQRMDKNWKRMFGQQIINNKSLFIDPQHDQKKQGFFAWAKHLFTRPKKTQRPKRSLSQQKVESSKRKNEQVENPQVKQQRKGLGLSEKNWLLIINTQKSVEWQKVYMSGCEGFPSRLRPSIWLYMARKQFPPNILPKVQHLLDEAQNKTTTNQFSTLINEIFCQIDKDVNRTPPPSLFKKGYLGDSLTRVLRAYSIYDKDLQYTQGMNFIVALILCVLTHHGENRGFQDEMRKSKVYFDVLENNCFVILVYMMMKKGLRKVMFIERQTINDLCIKLTSYIAKNSTLMYQKIEKSGFTIEMIFSPALISALTTAEIQFSLQKRVIDLLLISDFSFLYKVIGGFVASAQGLCQKLQAEMLYFYLKGNLYNEVYKVIGDDGITKMFKGL